MSAPSSRAGWLRGGLVGTSSTLITAVAHAWGGGELPRGAALTMLMAVCATVGAAVAVVTLAGRRTRAAVVIAALCAGQLLGHATLTLGGSEHAHMGPGLTAPMIALHAAAAVALGLLICAVEYLYVVGASVLCWWRLFATSSPRPASRATVIDANSVVVQSLLRRSGLRMRAPPVGV